MDKIKKLLVKELGDEFKRNIFNPFTYTHTLCSDFTIHKNALEYKGVPVVLLSVQSILIAYLILKGEREYEFTVINTIKTSYLVSYHLDFNILTKEVIFDAVVTDKNYDIAQRCNCPNILGLTHIIYSMIEVLKKNNYLTENNKICGI